MLAVKIIRMMLHCNIDGVVKLDGSEEKLASASLSEIQFWSQTWRVYLEVFPDANGADLLYLKVWLEGL